jgi:hypothetical protein
MRQEGHKNNERNREVGAEAETAMKKMDIDHG